MTSLVQKLAEGGVEDVQYMGHEALFSYLGPLDEAIEGIVDEAMSQIEPEIVELQGKAISPGVYVQTHQTHIQRKLLNSNDGANKP